MRLQKVRVQNYRSIRDTGEFEVERTKTIMVGPNEAGKSAILQALLQINPPKGVKGFDALRDYPRALYNDITAGKVKPEKTPVVSATFALEEADKAALPEAFRGCSYHFIRNLANNALHRLIGAPETPTFGGLKTELLRLAAHADARVAAPAEGQSSKPTPTEQLNSISKEWQDMAIVSGAVSVSLKLWLEAIVPLVDETDDTESKRLNRLLESVGVAETTDSVLKILDGLRPAFVLYSNYFRVKPMIHLRHLADRLQSGVLDDDQLDKRTYQLNAASVRLTDEIRKVWNPDLGRAEADKLLIRADGQYLKVVVEDDLGVEIELDQRSEGFQWLVSFFVVFFAEAADKNENAILLLDEPGLSLHGLKQRDFRLTISRLADDNQTIYTTHSPFLVGPDELDMVRVVEMTDRKVGTKVLTPITSSDPAALLPLQEALGYDLAQSLFAQQRNLVLEGLTDYWYLESVASLLSDGSEAKLNDKIALVPANAAGKVVYFATILHAHNLKVAALLDSDAAGDAAAQQDVLVHTLGNKRILRTKDYLGGIVPKAEIEDLLRETLAAIGKTAFGWDVSAEIKAQPGHPIVDVFASKYSDFSKYRLAKAFVRWTRDHEAKDLTGNERQQWTGLVEAINAALK